MKTLMIPNEYVFAVSPRGKLAIEADATEVLRLHNPRLLREPGRFDVLKFFEQVLPNFHGLDTGVEQLSDGVEGQACPDGRVLVSESTYSNACDGYGRARFTIAHECYHGIRHREQIRRVLLHRGEAVFYRRADIPPFRDPEWQADRFAAGVLMPAAMVAKLTRGVLRHRVADIIAATFQVSDRAARIRARDVMGAKAQ